MDASDIPGFVLGFLREIAADVREAEGVHTAVFPPGYKRRYGRERNFTFEADKRREHVELLEPGSPFLKLLLNDAKDWGGLAVVPSSALAAGSRVYSFRLEAYSSVKKHTQFLWAALDPSGKTVTVKDGVPPLYREAASGPGEGPAKIEPLKEGADIVMPAVLEAARRFSEAAVSESHEAYGKAMGRVEQYLVGLKQDTFLEEARIKKRLGEIQSKLYFTEDGLREIKLQRDVERLTHELHAIKKKNQENQEGLVTERTRHEEQLRRRHEPKLRVRLIAAALVQAPRASSPSGLNPNGSGTGA